MKEFKYECIKEIGIIGDADKRHQKVEIGHYLVDGEPATDKVYVWDYYFNKDGEVVRSNKAAVSIAMEMLEVLYKMVKSN